MSSVLSGFLDDQRSDVVTGGLVMLGVGSVAVWELFALPAAAENSLISQILHIDGVDDLGLAHLDFVVAPGLLEAGQRAQLFPDGGRDIGESLKAQIGEAGHGYAERDQPGPI